MTFFLKDNEVLFLKEQKEIDKDTIKETEKLQAIADKYSWYHTKREVDPIAWTLFSDFKL